MAQHGSPDTTYGDCVAEVSSVYSIEYTPLDDGLDKIVAEALDQFHVAGMALAVVGGDHIWEKGYGFANREKRTRVEPWTLFPMGSSTKTFTAAAASLLVDDMENHPDITWTSTMHQLIPDDFVLQSEYATTHVTLEDCLSHRSGLPGHHAQLGAKSVQEATRLLRHLSFTKEPRTEWQYSNHMYWAVSHMIEVQTGKSLEQFMTQRLWRPLEMDNTFLSLENADAHTIGRPHMSLAKSYQWDETINKLSPLPYWDDIGMSGAGALVSTVSDQAKWLRSFINRNGPLSHAGYEALTSPHMLMPPTSARFQGPHCYGMGWFIARYHGELVLFHPGGTVGFAANVILLPELNWGVVGMCNGSSDGILDVPMWHLVDEFLEIPFDRRINVFQEAMQKKIRMKAYLESAKPRLFPYLRNPPVPLSLKLREYSGRYVHPAYGTFTIALQGKELRGFLPGRRILDLDPVSFEHVSGDSFIASADVFSVMSLRLFAKFDVDSSGIAIRFGVEFNKDDMVWFQRAKQWAGTKY